MGKLRLNVNEWKYTKSNNDELKFVIEKKKIRFVILKLSIKMFWGKHINNPVLHRVLMQL